MAILTVAADTDFSAQALVNIDIIDFTAAAVATFTAAQFNNAAILNALTIDGSAGVNRIVINGGAVNLLGWTFANWTDGEDTITFNGTAADNIYLGTGHDDIFNTFSGDDFVAAGNGNDIITGGSGGDELHGGGGDDTFIYGAGDLDAGERIFGDAGTADTIRVNNSAGAYAFSTNATTLTGIERLQFNTTSTAIAEFTGAQIAPFTSVTGGAGVDTLRTVGAADLSALAFTFWSSNDQIVLNGTAAGETMTGTALADRFTGGGGNDTLNGGDGNDVFVYTAAADLSGAGETVNGGAGTADEIELAAAASYQLSNAVISGVERLDFAVGGATGVLLGSQFGAGLITQIDGSAGVDTLFVNGADVNLSGIAFSNWTNLTDAIHITGNGAAVSNLRGTQFKDIITGGSLGDFIRGNEGADIMSGGDGADTFIYNFSDHIEAGEQVTGGLGDDRIRVDYSFAQTELFDFTGAVISGVEALQFSNSGNSTVTLLGSQVGAGFINEFQFNGGGSNNVSILGAANLSSLTFDGAYSIDDSITITGTAGADVITGSSGRDIIIGGDGADDMNGGSGDDRFVVNSAFHILGDTYDGGAGLADTLVLNTGIAGTLIDAASITNVERLEFGANGGSGDFEDASFGLAAGRINTVSGSALLDRLDIRGSAINLTGVAFTNWTNGVDSLRLFGTAGDDIMIGSDQDDIFGANAGADALFGGLGNDTFEFRNVAVALGDSVDGGGGTGDGIVAQGVLDLSSVTIAGVERLDVRRDAGSGLNGVVTVLGSQVGAGAISLVTGSNNIDTLNVNGAAVDLSAVTFTSWTNGTDIINITGTSGADTLTGSTQNDVFNFSGGADAMNGGGGDDVFVYTSDGVSGDSINGGAGAGDTLRLQTSGDFSLDLIASLTGVEKWVFAGPGNLQLTATGAQLATGLNEITGDAFLNQLALSGAAVNLSGVAFSNWTDGSDVITITGTAGVDNLIGSGQRDNVIDNDLGDDNFNGGAGVDTLVSDLGHSDDATFSFLTGLATFSGGTFLHFTNFENITLGGGANVTGDNNANVITITETGATHTNNLNGGGGADTIIAGSGSDVISGGSGIDTINGGSGDDQIFIDDNFDVIIEAAAGGNDRILSSATYFLQAGVEIETMTTQNTAGVLALSLFGNEFNQLIGGNNGNNNLDGGAGADTLRGFGGNDTYFVDNLNDDVIEAAGGGNDRVNASVSYTLDAGQEIEIFTTTNTAGAGALNLTGNGFGQIIHGNAGANTLNGGGGNDQLRGFGGADIFVFNTALNAATNHDAILDFVAADDTIHLENAIFTLLTAGGLAANLFGAFASQDADDVILYDQVNGDLYYDSNGLTAGGQTLFADVTNGMALAAADFVVV